MQTILDVVTYVQRELDSGLSYRFACRVGMCGTCAMTVNGKPRWTCRTQASLFAGSTITIEPLRNFPIVKDLVIDMDSFFDKWQSAGGAFKPKQQSQTGFAAVKPDHPLRKAANAAIECINCGVCYSACDVVRWNSDYLGPAALNRSWSLVNDERDGDNRERLATIASDAGCFSCHTTQLCTNYCPKSLNPSASIAGLKREVVRNSFR